MATIAEVKKRVGSLLGLTRVGQDLSEPYVTRINTGYSEVIAALKVDNLVVWNTSTGTIPDSIAPHIIARIAFNLIDEAGVSGDRYDRIVARYNISMPEIRKAIRDDYVDLEEATDY